MARLFGTDGVRGVAGQDLTSQLALDVSRAAATVLHDSGAFEAKESAGRRPLAVVGRDPRASGEFLEAAVVAGLAGSGVDVLRLGVIPTPAVAFLTRDLGAELGVMLSASHNPAPDNGIKLFGAGGFKLPDAVEDEIEAHIGMPPRRVDQLPAGFGRVSDAERERDRYTQHLLSSLPATTGPDGQPGAPLAGLTVVVDCAHGAASDFAPRMLQQAGAKVIAIGAEPDGLNINDGCGSTHLDVLRAEVIRHAADAGIAHDGDADRVLLCDEKGNLIDGDDIMAMAALEMLAEKTLAGKTLVSTVMSNAGLEAAIKKAGGKMIRTAVGDKNVIDEMLKHDFNFGGEQSGHLIFRDFATTGDGLVAALQILRIMMKSKGTPLSKLAKCWTRFPQLVTNVKVREKIPFAELDGLNQLVAGAEKELAAQGGRLLLRYSGTEPKARLLVEGRDAAVLKTWSEKICGTIQKQIGA